jgi:hypothetical protein
MANNGRVKGQISLKGKSRGITVRGNSYSGTNRNTGNTRLSSSPSLTNGRQVARNSNSKTGYSANAGQTVGIKGATTGPGSRRAPVANSVPDRTTKNPSQYNTHVSSTIGLKGAGKPFQDMKRTTTNLDNTGDKISKNTRIQNPHVAFSAGLRGAKKNGAKGTASRSNLARGSNPKNSSSVYGMTDHTQQTRGLTKTRKQSGGAQTKLQSSGTYKKATAGGRKVAFMGNRREQNSTLRTQKAINDKIPAVVRAAARRAPSPGSSKPTFTSRVAKILSR